MWSTPSYFIGTTINYSDIVVPCPEGVCHFSLFENDRLLDKKNELQTTQNCYVYNQ